MNGHTDGFNNIVRRVSGFAFMQTVANKDFVSSTTRQN